MIGTDKDRIITLRSSIALPARSEGILRYEPKEPESLLAVAIQTAGLWLVELTLIPPPESGAGPELLYQEGRAWATGPTTLLPGAVLSLRLRALSIVTPEARILVRPPEGGEPATDAPESPPTGATEPS